MTMKVKSLKKKGIVLCVPLHNLAHHSSTYLPCVLLTVHVKLHPCIPWVEWVELAFVGAWQVVLKIQENHVKLDGSLKLGI
jgi:hypothetical protein